jgi:hypothetical protein
MSKRNNTVTRFINDIVGDTKELVDDILDRAKVLETDIRQTVKDVVVDDDASLVSSSDTSVAELQAAMAELTAKVDQLAALQLTAASPRSSTPASSTRRSAAA